ncbi:hypothetical protein ABE244_25675 [Bacillus toyonensis]|uniref:hypothetical protein n=1 Tax=Bacillus toyonensis TaxID=155322 RepID=UPI003D20F5F7
MNRMNLLTKAEIVWGYTSEKEIVDIVNQGYKLFELLQQKPFIIIDRNGVRSLVNTKYIRELVEVKED